MYAAINTGQVQPEQVDEVERVVQEQLVPVLKTIPGLKRHYGMVDRSTGKVVTIIIYETEEAARSAGTSEQNRQIVENLSPFLVSQPQRDVYEVRLELEL